MKSPAFLTSMALLAACGGGGATGTHATSSAGTGTASTSGSSGTTSTGGTGGVSGTGGAKAGSGTATGSGGATGTGGTGGASLGAPYVYVGGYSDSIHVFHLSLADGSLTPVGSPVAAGANPSFLATDPQHHTLFAVNENSGSTAAVASFSIDAQTGALAFLSRVSSAGDGPAYVSTDRSGAFALVANYGGGTVAVLPVGAGGVLGAAVDVHDQGGTSANPHELRTDAANHFALVPNKGLSTVTEFAFDATTGKLSSPATFTTAAGGGPRHLDWHPTAPYAYLIDENDSTMSALAYDAATGKLTHLQTLSTLPAGYTGTSTGAEVQVSPSGQFVYGSNRGHDSIVVFHVENDGTLTRVGDTPTMGQTPRHFQIEASGALLLVANQGSSNVVSFRVDAVTGMLTATGQSVSVPSPSYVGTVYLKGP
jgi:6-phosphogluconolactonase